MAPLVQAIGDPLKDIKEAESDLVRYSSNYSKHLPPGTAIDFQWKDYCPSAFRLIQELEGIDHDDYMQAVRKDETLRKVSAGRPGNLFILSKDDRFIIKILRRSEVKVILETLHNYYRHFQRYRSTILVKTLGIHGLKPVGGSKAYFVVLENALQSDMPMHRVFDLKGSSQGRRSKYVKLRETNVLKDLDLGFCFRLDQLTRLRLLKQIKFDCEFLESEGFMDYSLLLGLHIKGSPQGLFSNSGRPSKDFDSCCQDSFSHLASNIGSTTVTGSPDRLSESNRTSSAFPSPAESPVSCVTVSTPSTGSLSPNAGLMIPRNSTDSDSTSLDVCQQSTHRPRSKFGLRMSARAFPTPPTDSNSSKEMQKNICGQKWYDAVLYVRIVDTYKNYGVKKKIEHYYKSIQHDSKSIPAVNPKVYSSRFQEFLGQIFLADDSG